MPRSGPTSRGLSLGAAPLRFVVVGVVAAGSAASWVAAEERFLKLTPSQIKARLAGIEITDGVHWAEQYMRDGTFLAFHMGTPSKGKWYVRDGELCLDDGKNGPECKEVWLSSSKVEFRVPGSGLPPFEGVLQRQEPRG
jgi:hypothetical protein